MNKKITAILLTFAMLFSLAPLAFAANGDGVLTAEYIGSGIGGDVLLVKYESGNNSIKAGFFEVLSPDGDVLLKSPVVPFDSKAGQFAFALTADLPENCVIAMTEDKGNKPVVVKGLCPDGYGPVYRFVVPEGYNDVFVEVDGEFLYQGLAGGATVAIAEGLDGVQGVLGYSFGATTYLPVGFALDGGDPFANPDIQGYDVATLAAAQGVDKLVVSVATGKSHINNATASQNMSAVVTRAFDKENGIWVEKLAAIGHSGRTGIKDLGVKREGDGGTPSGVYELGRPFGILPDPGSGIQPYVVVERNEDWWIDSVSWLGGKYYNEWVKQSVLRNSGEIGPTTNITTSQGEHLANTSPSYNYALVIEYNTGDGPRWDENGVGYGSAIFMHRQGNSPGTTAGCINMTEENMIFMIRFVTPGTQIVISPSVAYLENF